MVRIFKNYGKIRETRKFIDKNRKIWYYEFIRQQKFYLSDWFFVDNRFLKKLIYIGNILFRVYGKALVWMLWILLSLKIQTNKQ